MKSRKRALYRRLQLEFLTFFQASFLEKREFWHILKVRFKKARVSVKSTAQLDVGDFLLILACCQGLFFL